MEPHKLLRESIWSFLRMHRGAYTVMVACVLIMALQRVIVPHYYGLIVAAVNDADLVKATRYFVILNFAWVLFQGVGGIASWIDADKTPAFHNHLRSWFFDYIMKSAHPDSVDVGDLLSKTIKFPWAVSGYVDLMQEFVFGNLLTVIISSIYLYFFHPSLGFIFFGIYLLNIWLAVAFHKGCREASKDAEAVFDKSTNDMEDILSNLPAVQGAMTEKHEKGFLSQVFEKVNDAQRRALRCQMPYRVGFVILGTLTLIGLNTQAMSLLRRKLLTNTSSMVSIFISSYSTLSIVMNTYWVFREVLQTSGRMDLVYEFLLDNKIQKEEQPTEDQAVSSSPRIALQKVLPDRGLRYPVTTTIEPLSRVLIKGPIGSGKSSLAKALAGLQDIREGRILFDEHPLTDVQRRRRVFYVPQNAVLFNRTLWENISYGTTAGMDREEPLKLLREAGLGDLADRFLSEMDRVVGRGGANLSGGEKQIVWLLRASLRQAQTVLLLDEPTASLDPDSIAAVEKVVRVLGRKRTIIVITHDPDFLQGWFDHQLEIDGKSSRQSPWPSQQT